MDNYEDYSYGLRKDVELFLVEHDYSLNNISWMAVPADYVPVQFHEFGIDEENGKEVHEQRETKLKNFSIYDSVQEVKHREQEELVSAIRQYGFLQFANMVRRLPMAMNGTLRVIAR